MNEGNFILHLNIQPYDGEPFDEWMRRVAVQVGKEIMQRSTEAMENLSEAIESATEGTNSLSRAADETPQLWTKDLSPREHQEVQFAHEYVENFGHGTDGHSRLTLIDHLAALLYKMQDERNKYYRAIVKEREVNDAQQRVLDEKTGELGRVQRLVAHFQRLAERAETNNDQLADALQARDEKIKTLEEQATQYDNDWATLQTEITELRQMRDNLSTSARASSQRIKELEKEVARLVQVRAEHIMRANREESARHTAEQKVMELTGRVRDLEALVVALSPGDTRPMPSSVEREVATIRMYEDVLAALTPNQRTRDTLRGYKSSVAFSKAVERVMEHRHQTYEVATAAFNAACTVLRKERGI